MSVPLLEIGFVPIYIYIYKKICGSPMKKRVNCHAPVLKSQGERVTVDCIRSARAERRTLIEEIILSLIKLLSLVYCLVLDRISLDVIVWHWISAYQRNYYYYYYY